MTEHALTAGGGLRIPRSPREERSHELTEGSVSPVTSPTASRFTIEADADDTPLWDVGGRPRRSGGARPGTVPVAGDIEQAMSATTSESRPIGTLHLFRLSASAAQQGRRPSEGRAEARIGKTGNDDLDYTVARPGESGPREGSTPHR